MATEIPEEWLSIMDGHECPDCHDLHGTIKPTSYWDATGRPRVRATICNGKCRCILINANWNDGDLIGEINKLLLKDIKQQKIELIKGITVDAERGGLKFEEIDLSLYRGLKDAGKVPLISIAEHGRLLLQWKIENSLIRLPNSYYKLNRFSEQVSWLKGRVVKNVL